MTGYIGEQNIKLLLKLINGIDLFKLPDLLGNYKYIIYIKTRIKLKPYKGYIKSGLY